MTKPYLYIDGDQGQYNSLYFPGDSNGDGPTVTDSGARNLLPLNVAAVQDIDGLGIAGTDMTSLGFMLPPVDAGTGTIADEAINTGVLGVEWTGTTSSEQVSTAARMVQVNNGDTLEAGAWVYLESPTNTTVGIRWVGFNSAGSVTENSGYNNVSIAPDTWTYITRSAVVGNAGTVFAAVYIESNGAQSVGDKLYIGALFLGFDASSWVYPVQPDRDILDFRFTAKILSDGTLFSSRDRDSAGGVAMHIEAVNEGFHVRNSTHSTSDVTTSRTYTTATGIYDYGVWYDFKWTYEPSTGTHTFYIRDNGWVVIDTGSVATTTEDMSSWYGFATLGTGLTVTNSTHALINNFGLFYGEFGWIASGLDDHSISWTGDLLGSELVVYSDGTTQNYNEAFYGAYSGWIINADSTAKGGLQLTNRAELNLGSGDFTIVQSFAAVASHAGFTPTFDSYSPGGVKLRQSGNEFRALIGSEAQLVIANPLDGQYRSMLVERESGVENRIFIDDFDTPADSAVDTGTNIDTTQPINLGFDDLATNASWLPMLLGVTIIFKRTLEQGEKRDLQYWIEDGFSVDSEPVWLRSDATLYLNPNDPVQRAEYAARDRLINLALDVPDGVWLRYDLTTIDGASNPVLSYNEVRFANPSLYEELSLTDGYDVGPVPRIPVGHGIQPYVLRMPGGANNYVATVPLEELGVDWAANDFTISFWMKKFADAAADQYIVGQGPFATANAWSIRLTSFETVSLWYGVNEILQSSATVPLNELTMITYTRSGNRFDVYFNDVADDFNTNAEASDLAYDLTYGGNTSENNVDALLGSLHIWDRALSAAEISAVYQANSAVSSAISMGAATLTDSFATVSRVWERI